MEEVGYLINDPRPIKDEAPYTFHIPSKAELAEIEVGLFVKLIFSAVPPSEKYHAERMWVRVTERVDDQITGELDNNPEDIPALQEGSVIQFNLHHVIGIIWEDEKQKQRFSTDFDGWFGRCFVDNAVLERRARVGFIYREEPEYLDTDRYPDTGWRIRADINQLTDEEYEDTPMSYVAIGAVLNRDDSFVDLLGAPVGSAFLRGHSDDYVASDFNS